MTDARTRALIGSRLGPYEITAKLGQGGMGEVYRATDTKLRREVAIKVLPEAFTADRERLARFEREAQLLAQLQHPNIAGIFGLEESGGVRALVMELVEGSTLAERMEQGRLPLEECVAIARQMAEALEAAHEKGIVHRDLKPQNVKLTADGKVKVLDFGLAKAMDSGTGAMPADLAHSPTLTLGNTLEGMILGTAAYMAPEQARGGAVDKRADIWAFGVLLFEMLTGEQLFAEESVVDTLSAVMRKPIDLELLPAETPPRVRELVRHCLERDSKRRLRDIGDARLELEERGAEAASERPARAISSSRRPWLLASTGALVALLAGLAIGRLAAPSKVTTISYAQLTHRHGAITAARFAADGQTVVYSAAWDGRPVDIYVGRVGSPDARSLGLEGTALLSVSSTGELAVSVGFHATIGRESLGTLATVPLDGGAPRQMLEDVVSADWSPDGKQLAVSRFVGDECRLEYPVGTVVRATPGWISDVRVSADGNSIGFLEHPNRGDNTAVPSVVDRLGNVQALSSPEPLEGLAWSPDGSELWSSNQDSGALRALRAGAAPRVLLALPGRALFGDAARDGRILAVHGSITRELMGKAIGADDERRLGWFDWSFPESFSADGRTLLFEEQQLQVADGYAIFVRGTDGSPAVRIGEGKAFALSPDGRWALSVRDSFGERPRLTLIPTGAGQPRELESDGVRYQAWAAFLPDGKSFIGLGRLPGKGIQLFHRKLDGPPVARAISPEGIRITLFGIIPSPDGEQVVVPEADGRMMLRSVKGDSAVPVPGVRPDEEPAGWTPDGRSIYVVRPSSIPLEIERLDLATGERTPWTTLAPADRSGVFRLGPVLLSRDGQFAAYSFIRVSSELYLINGAR
jgi:serine/threonine protein kinase